MPYLHHLSLSSLRDVCASLGGTASICTRGKKNSVIDFLLRHHNCFSKYQSMFLKYASVCRQEFREVASSIFGNLCLTTNLERVFDASVHIVQEESGSGVCVDDGSVLTCAHVVCADDDIETDDEEAPSRVGRLKVVILGNGDWGVARCTHCFEDDDLALLTIEALDSTALHSEVTDSFQDAQPDSIDGPNHIRSTSRGNRHRRRQMAIEENSGVGAGCRGLSPVSEFIKGPIICIGNPSEYDLESDVPDAKIQFSPPFFHSSNGKMMGKTDATRLGILGDLGDMRHTAWTYWGHSGAPLINGNAKLVGIHSSWDAEKGTRHCVGASKVYRFLQDAGVHIRP